MSFYEFFSTDTSVYCYCLRINERAKEIKYKRNNSKEYIDVGSYIYYIISIYKKKLKVYKFIIVLTKNDLGIFCCFEV